jgi:peptidoglycan DL-endopeptidase CwlO
LPSCDRRSPHRRALRLALRLLVVAALSLPLAMLSTAEQDGAQASPARIRSLQAQLEKLNQQADQLVEQYLQAKLELQQTQKLLGSLRADEQQAAQVLQDAQDRLGARAAAAYIQGPGVDLSALLESRNPSDTLDRVQVLDLLARQDGDLMDTLRVAGDTYQQRKQALEASQREQAKALANLEAKKRQAEQTVSRTKALLAQVKASDRARLLAAANNGGGSDSGGSGAPAPSSFPKVAASGGAAKAVAYAKAQVGKPYVYGASGPSSFDCSGLTMMAWAQAGVSLPHSSSAQYSATRRISSSELQPGDLVFYYSPISHVAIYVGGGMQVAATHTGDYVRLQALHSGITGYGRPAG